MDIPDTKKFHSAVCQIETRASGMVWGPRSMGPALILGVYEKVPPARNVPSDHSILIPRRASQAKPARPNCQAALLVRVIELW